MESWVIITIIFLLVAAIAIPSAIYFTSNKPSLSPANLETCNSLAENGKDKVNVVFFSSKENAQDYMNNLLSISPFKENQKAINFFYIDSYVPQCELYKGIALYCYSRDLIKKASSCPNDFIVVVQARGANVRSSAYMNVISINSNLPEIVFAHEFAHVFANLADEYSPALLSKSAKNCVSSCDKLPADGCFLGCSKENYYRSTRLGIMRSLDANIYGLFDEQLLSSKLQKSSSAITGKVVDVQCQNEQYYLIEGNYINGEIKILSKSMELGCVNTNGYGPFNYTITLEDNSQLSEGEFNAELIFTDARVGGEVYNNEGAFYLKIPVIKAAKSIEVRTPDSSANFSLENIQINAEIQINPLKAPQNSAITISINLDNYGNFVYFYKSGATEPVGVLDFGCNGDCTERKSGNFILTDKFTPGKYVVQIYSVNAEQWIKSEFEVE